MSIAWCWWLEKLILPLVTLAVATIVAYFFTERWQRARQRRELQFREIIRFSEKADRIRGGLAAMFPAVQSGVEQAAELRKKQLDISGDIASLTSEIYRFAIFGKPLIYASLVAMHESASETFRVCLNHGREVDFESAFGRLCDHTQTVIKESYRAMKFLTRKQERTLEQAVAQAVARWARPT